MVIIIKPHLMLNVESTLTFLRALRRTGLHSWAARHSQGFVNKNLGTSPGLLGQLVTTVVAHQPGELPKFLLTKPCE